MGQAPIGASVYELEKLRCNLCGEVFTAREPDDVGAQKYAASSASLIALLKYGSGFPFLHRLERLQESLGTPLPASTPHRLCHRVIAFRCTRAATPGPADVSPLGQLAMRQVGNGNLVVEEDWAPFFGLAVPIEPRTPAIRAKLASDRAGWPDAASREVLAWAPAPGAIH